jgi:hypothetical protein
MKKLLPICLAALSGCFIESYDRRVISGPVDPPVTRDEAERLAAAGVSEPALIELIEQRGARPLSADDIVAIKKAGASDAVIAKMQNTIREEPRVVYVEQPAYYYPSSYYYGPYWYPRWGFSYSYWGRRHVSGVRVGW